VTSPQLSRQLASTLGEQLAHLRMHVAGEPIAVFEPPRAKSRWREEEEDNLAPEIPPGITRKEWMAYNTPSTARVLEILCAAAYPMGTQQIADKAGRSRPTVHRILCAAAALGEVRRAGEIKIGHSHFWEIAK